MVANGVNVGALSFQMDRCSMSFLMPIYPNFPRNFLNDKAVSAINFIWVSILYGVATQL